MSSDRVRDGWVVFFDIDGTLAPTVSTAAHLAAKLGTSEAVEAAESAFAAGSIDNAAVSRIDAAGWKGHRVEDVCVWLEDLPVLDGISETVAWCRDRGMLPVLATLAWRPVMHALAERFGFEPGGGPVLETVDGVFTGAVGMDFDEFDKRDVALGFAASRGVSPSRCAAVGDSRSDIPLFSEVGCAIALNASDALREISDHAVEGGDLREIIPLLEAWMFEAASD